MSRTRKNIITIIIVLIWVGIHLLTIYFASQSLKINTLVMDIPNQDEMMEPPDLLPMEDTPNENFTMTPPETPTDDNGKRQAPPDKPVSDNGENSESMVAPLKPDSSMVRQIPSTNHSFETENNHQLAFGYYVAFIIESIVISIVIIIWILTAFHKKSFSEVKQDKHNIILLGMGTILLTLGLVFMDDFLSTKLFGSSASTEKIQNTTQAKGDTVIANKQTLNGNYSSRNSDESVILVTNEGKATIKKSTITKTGDSTDTENSDFYGINAAVLVQKNSKATIKDSKITTSSKGGNAVFATGKDAKIYLTDTTIETTGSSSSRGLDATYGGYIEAEGITVTTEGGSCASLATDRGEGTIIVRSSNLTTNGTGSPIIYSTGDISTFDVTGVANGSQMVVIEGKNSASIADSTLEASGKGNRGDIDQSGIMIYQSMSGDAEDGIGSFSASNSSLSIQKASPYYQTAPMFFVTNTKAIIQLENTKLSFGSNLFLKVAATTEWGNAGSNGGDVTISTQNQKIDGNIEVDSLSSLTLNLKDQSTYQGVINSSNTAKEIHLSLNQNSKITLMGDSYITSLEDEDSSYSNISFNGYHLYVNGVSLK